MKPKEYVKKYELSKDDRFDHNYFVQDLTIDFLSLLEVGKSRESYKGFENAVRAIRMKWDAINNKTVGQLPQKLWNYFYATVVGPMKDELFPEIKQRKEMDKAEREERKKYWEDQEKRMDDWMWGAWFHNMATLFKRMQTPTSSFTILGLSSDAKKWDVQAKFKQLVMRHHPDKGGNADAFNKIVEAKNKCLSYLQGKGE